VLRRRTFLKLGAAAMAQRDCCVCAISGSIYLIVGLSAGGNTDIVARLIGEWLTRQMGQPFTTPLVMCVEPSFPARWAPAPLPFIVSLTTHYRVDSVSPFHLFVEQGCLISYGNDLVEQYGKQLHAHIEGSDPADPPVQAPTKFEMVIKTAK
jgi:hypothetical protein